MAKVIRASIVLALSLFAGRALADGSVPPPVKTDAGPSAPAEVPAWEKAPPERRSGFSVGILAGGGLGNITGYPADIEKRGKAEYRADLGAAYGGGGTLWLGGALTDWLVFGVGLGGASYQGNGITVQGFTFVFHTEVFPLYWMGGAFRELGLFLDTGAGSYNGELNEKPAGTGANLVPPVIESGAASRVGVGVFYDGLRVWKLSAGPYVGLDYTWSATLTQPMVVLGLRGALYVKAPVKKK